MSWSNPNNSANPSHFYPTNQKPQTSHPANQQFTSQNKTFSNKHYGPPHLRDSSQLPQQSQDLVPLEKSQTETQNVTNRLSKDMDEIKNQLADVLKILSLNNEKGKLPSQTETNPKYNSRGVNLCEDDNINSVNAVTTLRSGKRIDNNVGNPNNSSSKVGNPDISLSPMLATQPLLIYHWQP